jgi:hypothetical protein
MTDDVNDAYDRLVEAARRFAGEPWDFNRNPHLDELRAALEAFDQLMK